MEAVSRKFVVTEKKELQIQAFKNTLVDRHIREAVSARWENFSSRPQRLSVDFLNLGVVEAGSY